MPRTRPEPESTSVPPIALDVSLQIAILFVVVNLFQISPEPEPPLVIHLKRVTPKMLAALPENARRRLRGADSVVLIIDKEPMSPLEAKVWLRDKYQDAEKEARG